MKKVISFAIIAGLLLASGSVFVKKNADSAPYTGSFKTMLADSAPYTGPTMSKPLDSAPYTG